MAKDENDWTTQAARNALDVIPYLIEPGDDVPQIHVEDMTERIRKAYPDRQAWNQAVQESPLEPEEKIWLVVP